MAELHARLHQQGADPPMKDGVRWLRCVYLNAIPEVDSLQGFVFKTVGPEELQALSDG